MFPEIPTAAQPSRPEPEPITEADVAGLLEAPTPARTKRIEALDFEAWFRGSKVVDAHGKPRLVYHGTVARFKRFDEDRISHFGFHVGTKEQATGMGNKLMTLHACIKNPLRLPDLGTWGYQGVIREARLQGISISEAEYDAVFNVNDNDRATRRLLEQKGYDGVVYENLVEGDGDSYIAFRSEQLRLAAPTVPQWVPNTGGR